MNYAFNMLSVSFCCSVYFSSSNQLTWLDSNSKLWLPCKLLKSLFSFASWKVCCIPICINSSGSNQNGNPVPHFLMKKKFKIYIYIFNSHKVKHKKAIILLHVKSTLLDLKIHSSFAGTYTPTSQAFYNFLVESFMLYHNIWRISKFIYHISSYWRI